MIKIIAFYLPQFHRVKENDLWWGEGFTEWTNVASAKQLFKGHNQPKIPLNNNYYDLLNISTHQWQYELSSSYNIYGFAFYHYWFEGRLILEKPIEALLKSSIKQNFCFYWANHDWKKSWNGSSEILIKQTYGDCSDWDNHFDYFLRFFKDDRYIKKNGMPVLIIFKAINIINYDLMIQHWNKKAIENGFPGIYIIQTIFTKTDLIYDSSNSIVVREPDFSLLKLKKRDFVKRKFFRFLNEFLKIPYVYTISQKKIMRFILDKVNIITNKPVYFSFFSSWDNTPRHSKRGFIIKQFSPENFKLLTRSLKSRTLESNLDFLFINAWNEWGEGMYIEPDQVTKFSLLEIIKDMKNDN